MTCCACLHGDLSRPGSVTGYGFGRAAGLLAAAAVLAGCGDFKGQDAPEPGYTYVSGLPDGGYRCFDNICFPIDPDLAPASQRDGGRPGDGGIRRGDAGSGDETPVGEVDAGRKRRDGGTGKTSKDAGGGAGEGGEGEEGGEAVSSLVLAVNPVVADADGEDTIFVSVTAYEVDGKPAAGETVTIETTIGELGAGGSKGVQGKLDGTGSYETALTSVKAGDGTVTARIKLSDGEREDSAEVRFRDPETGEGGEGGEGSEGGEGGEGPCRTYCDTMKANCAEVYKSDSDCLFTCGNMDEDGQDGDREGDTLQCRQAWAEEAAAGETSRACERAEFDSRACKDFDTGDCYGFAKCERAVTMPTIVEGNWHQEFTFTDNDCPPFQQQFLPDKATGNTAYKTDGECLDAVEAETTLVGVIHGADSASLCYESIDEQSGAVLNIHMEWGSIEADRIEGSVVVHVLTLGCKLMGDAVLTRNETGGP